MGSTLAPCRQQTFCCPANPLLRLTVQVGGQLDGGHVEAKHDHAGRHVAVKNEVFDEAAQSNDHPACNSRIVWLNPRSSQYWDYSESTRILQRLMNNRMFPLTLEGLDGAMRELLR